MILISENHHEWAERIIAEHDKNKPFAPENGEQLKFSVGDEVIYTNEYGVEFKRRITGFYTPEKKDTTYARGGRYMLDYDCFWVPVKESSLRKLSEQRTEQWA